MIKDQADWFGPFLLSEYNKRAAKKEWSEQRFSVTGQITIEKLSEKQIAYVRHTGTYESLAVEYPYLIQILFQHANKQNLLIEDQNMVLAIYHDNPEFSDEEQFRTSLCISVPDEITIHEDGILGKMTLEGGLYAVGHFSIRPEQFADAWNYMYQEWLTGSGYVPRNSYPFESYINNPNDNPEHISEVDIYVPIEPIHF
ncbi:MAG: GyrI-like domain-containing protein [Clostridiales bacterium]|nr:GyrI-like domain-containing protein [Clostridiales bacterium]